MMEKTAKPSFLPQKPVTTGRTTSHPSPSDIELKTAGSERPMADGVRRLGAGVDLSHKSSLIKAPFSHNSPSAVSSSCAGSPHQALFQSYLASSGNTSLPSASATNNTSALSVSNHKHPSALDRLSMESLSTRSSPSNTVSLTAAPITSSPSTSLASAVQLATFGVGIGPGVNPNVSTVPSGTGVPTLPQNNPPIVNTGNNGPMCVQPGDWVCSSCGFVNWRRRRVCMRCFPFADTNEMSHSIASGAILAAQLAAGIEPSAEVLSSLAQPKRHNTDSSGFLASMCASTSLNSSPNWTRPELQSLQRELPCTPSLHNSPESRQGCNPSREKARSTNRYLSLHSEPSGQSTPSSFQSHSPQPMSKIPSSSSSYFPTSTGSQLPRCPSMPALHLMNPVSLPGRSIWTCGSTTPAAAPIDASNSAIENSSTLPAYRAYKPSSVFTSNGDNRNTYTPRLTASPVLDFRCRPGSSLSINSPMMGLQLDLFGEETEKPSLHISAAPQPADCITTNSGNTAACLREAQPENPTLKAASSSNGRSDNSLPSLEQSLDDVLVFEPGLSKSKAIIQPPTASASPL